MFILRYLVIMLWFAIFWYLIFLCSILTGAPDRRVRQNYCLYLNRLLIFWTCQILWHYLLGKTIFITTILGTPLSQGVYGDNNSLNTQYCLTYDNAGFKDCGPALWKSFGVDCGGAWMTRSSCFHFPLTWRIVPSV